VERTFESYIDTIPRSKRLGSLTYELKDAVGKTGFGFVHCSCGCCHRFTARAARVLGLPTIRVHDLRQTNATLLRLGGADTVTISRLLGHASLAITERYRRRRGVLRRVGGAGTR